MTNKFFTLISSIIILCLAFPALASSNPPTDGTIKGKVLDKQTNKPVEYATIALFKTSDKSLISGASTSPEGIFEIKNVASGNYYLEVTFIGYQKKSISNIVYKNGDDVLTVNNILLELDAEVLESVEVVGEKNAVQYDIDKKIVNVDRQLAATAGTAVDILSNVPSVQVDIDGSVSLRGSSSFTVLINGRPSPLSSEDALQQIPASTIENIEIITNPSVKFDPDGTSGIINIITKKNKLQGISGIFNANVGSFGRYGGDALINIRKKKFNFFVGADYNERPYPGEEYNEMTNLLTDNTIISEVDETFAFNTYNFKAGFDYNITDNDIFNVNFSYGGRKMFREGTTYSKEFSNQTPDDIRKFSSDNTWDRSSNYIAADFGFEHKFEKKGHKINALVLLRGRSAEEYAKFTQRDTDDNVTNGGRNTELEPEDKRLRVQLDYTLPIGENDKFEAGYILRYADVKEENGFFDRDITAEEETYIKQSEFSYFSERINQNHSVYALYAGKISKFGYQAGLRFEYINRDFKLVNTGDDFSIAQANFFPTVHTSYQINKNNQLMLSYARRIKRPRGYYLEPFETWQDPYNIRKGDPKILPQLIDSFEMGYLKYFGDNSFSLEGFYRITNQKIDRIRTLHPDYTNVYLTTYQNIGQDYSMGLEAMFNLKLIKWWDTNIMGSFYKYIIDSIIDGELNTRESNNWNARWNNTFKIAKSTQLQLNANYTGPSASTQGTREGMFMTSAGFKQSFLNNKISGTLQVNDIFRTGRRISRNEGEGFSEYNERFRLAPAVTFTLSYKLNNFKQKKKQHDEEMDSE